MTDDDGHQRKIYACKGEERPERKARDYAWKGNGQHDEEGNRFSPEEAVAVYAEGRQGTKYESQKGCGNPRLD